MKYRKNPVVIEAIEWTGSNVLDIKSFVGDTAWFYNDELYIDTLEGGLKATIGDYIIKGVKGEFYPCKPDIFEATYEKLQ